MYNVRTIVLTDHTETHTYIKQILSHTFQIFLYITSLLDNNNINRSPAFEVSRTQYSGQPASPNMQE